MSMKSILISLVVVLLLALLVYSVESRQEAPERRVLPQYSLEGLTQFSVLFPEKRYRFRQPKKALSSIFDPRRFWHGSLQGPFYRTESVQELLQNFNQLELQSQVDRGEFSSPEHYGLFPAAIQLSFSPLGGRKFVLSIGAKNEYLGLRYLQIAGFPEILLSSESALFELTPTVLESFQEPELLRFHPEELESLIVSRSDGEVLHLSRQTSLWFVEGGEADQPFVRGYLGKIGSMKLYGLQEELNPDIFGLPELTFIFSFQKSRSEQVKVFYDVLHKKAYLEIGGIAALFHLAEKDLSKLFPARETFFTLPESSALERAEILEKEPETTQD